MLRRLGRADGFSLLEALVALVLLGAGLVPMLATVRSAVRAEADLGEVAELVALAEHRLTALELLPVDSLATYLRPREGRFAEPYGDHRWRAVLRLDPRRPSLVEAAVLVSGPGGEFALETAFHRPDRTLRERLGSW